MFEANSCVVFFRLFMSNQQTLIKERPGDDGYATETENYMPLALDLSHKLLQN
jgi:S-adenosylmethionine synthetase